MSETQIEKAVTSYDDVVNELLTERAQDFINYKQALQQFREDNNESGILASAVEMTNNILRDTLSSYRERAIERTNRDNYEFIEKRIGKVSLYKNLIIEGQLVRQMKTVEELKDELKKLCV